MIVGRKNYSKNLWMDDSSVVSHWVRGKGN